MFHVFVGIIDILRFYRVQLKFRLNKMGDHCLKAKGEEANSRIEICKWLSVSNACVAKRKWSQHDASHSQLDHTIDVNYDVQKGVNQI